jgi:hypothetical protein
MKCFQVRLPSFEQLSRPDQTRLVLGLVSFFAHLGSCRLLTYVTPWKLENVVKARRELAVTAPEEWQRRRLREEVQLLRRVAKDRQLLKISHYLLVEDDDVSAADLAAWGVYAEEQAAPPPLGGQYQERVDHLEPVIRDETGRWQVDNSRPRAAILASHELQRVWGARRPLADLVNQAEGPLVLAVDLRKTRPERVEMAANSWQAVAREGGGRTVNPEAAKALQAAEFALNADGEAVHEARVAILILEAETARLRQRTRALARRLTPHMGVDWLYGYQQAAAELFAPVARPPGLPAGHHNVLSSGAAMMAGVWGYGSPQTNDGVYVGERLSLSGGGSRGLYYIQGWRGQRPHHLNAFGKTGSGKSTNIRALLGREAEQGTQIIILDPQPHVRRFVNMFDPDTVAYHRVGYGRLTFNPLDVVWDRLDQQSDYVRAILKIMLNPDGDVPRRFTVLEVAALDAALKATYDGYDWADLLADQSQTPLLELFCKRLQSCGQAGRRLAEEIWGLYVAGERAATFNAPSSLDTRLRQPVVVYDFSPVFSGNESSLEALYYFITLSSVYREVRANPDRRQIIFVDEFGAMMREPSLVKSLAIMYKTFRTFKAGMWIADQNPFTLAGLGDKALAGAAPPDLEQRLSILRNTTRTLAFNLDYDDAEQLRLLYPRQILDTHVNFLTRAEAGQAVIRSDDEGTDIVYFSLKSSEINYLMGS